MPCRCITPENRTQPFPANGSEPSPSNGHLILRWILDEERTLGYLAARSAIAADRLMDLITGAGTPTALEISALATVTSLTEEQLQEAARMPGASERTPVLDPLQCLTVKDVASLLQVSTDTVRSAIEIGSLPSFVVGQRSVRVTRTALEQHLIQVGGAA